MNKNKRRGRRLALLASGALLPVFGNCLPEDYFALSARALSVGLADSLLATAVNPIYEALGLATSSPPADNATDAEEAAATDSTEASQP